MNNLNRIHAVNTVAALHAPVPEPAAPVDMSSYGEDVFSADVMREYLPKATAEKLLATINNGAPLDPAIAADVAHAMKHWALERGATHFTHWFLPLTGTTAEKHDSFLEIRNGKPIMAFSGKNLIISEPDASSFPSGGLRSTFEARGYTAWDPTSPAFIKRHGNGATLCIPTAFCSYTGEALDKKTPLLRSMQALSASVKRLMKCFGKEEANVKITLGPEQEYFLIDKNFYYQRPDLVQTGRTVFGAPPPKHQQLEDHYFGSIKMRILNFMTEVEQELWKLGIPAKTRHNEVAPAQFELAPMFEELNLACDHNMLVMEILREVADRNGLVCLLHEKPFAGVNGSGKHNNWSLAYGSQNLLDPGTDPHQNAIFLTVLTAIIEAIDLHSDMLRASVTGAGNDHRLGANEAPPAIISMYLGDQLADVIEQLEKGAATSCRQAGTMKIGVDTLPPLPRDATDRNRTSPFAFTGNKFEFRAPGSSQSCSGPNTVLNTIVAESIDRISDELEKLPKEEFNTGLQHLLSRIISAHKRIIFNGNGYTDAWEKEAQARGLLNLRQTPDCLPYILAAKNIRLFADHRVFTELEVRARYEIILENYCKTLHIEAVTMLDMVRREILPAISAYLRDICETARASMDIGVEPVYEKELAARLSVLCRTISDKAAALDDALSAVEEITDITTLSYAYRDEIHTCMHTLRVSCDEAETITADKYWPFPTYDRLLFGV